EIYCLLDSAPLFDNEEFGESVIVLHRFGGTYGPAMFLLTANPLEMSEPNGAITLTLANRQLMPLQVFKLDKIRVSANAVPSSKTVPVIRKQVDSENVKVDINEKLNEPLTPIEAELSKAETLLPEYDPAETPPLDAEGLWRLEQQLRLHPRATLARWREIFGYGSYMTMNHFLKVIDLARRALESPEEFLAEADVEIESTQVLPPDFSFPGMDLDEIDIDPYDQRFERDSKMSLLGWVLGAGPFLLSRPPKKKFRFHHQPQFTSRFIYPLEEPSPGAPVEIALFGNFGAGRYYSKYIAKQFRARKFPYVIHLGNVYYGGRRSEYREYFETLLDPILADTSLFTLNSNRDMYSGGIPYFDYISKRAAYIFGKQKQEGSYFCLRSERFQIIGIDTAFFGGGRYKEPALVEWLQNVLRDGRQAGCMNILLSADHPYDHNQTELTKLLDKDLKLLALEERLVDVWFWGNEYYCALYDHKPSPSAKIPALPFIGSCLGHGGYPYVSILRRGFEPAPIIFLETEARFPRATGLRPDMGNNGYCVLQLNADGSIGLCYIDWMSNLRFAASLTRGKAGAPLRVMPADV
ncbi:MAG TPA: metallophosphoesterase, partial [Blastocatellia bacterium]|nr:metallophosphoesterase [Blastocatellia bacterium]